MKKLDMQKITLTASLCLASLISHADDFNLYYEANSNTAPVKVEAATNLDKIVFTDKEVKIIDASGKSATVKKEGLTRLFFSTEKNVTSINDVMESGSANGIKDKTVRDITGRIVSNSGDTSVLPQGIYVVDGKKLIIK